MNPVKPELRPVQSLAAREESQRYARHRASAARVAVLPVVNLSGADHEDVADGLTVLLVANVATRPSLDVVSRTKTMQLVRRKVRPSEAARELRVDCIVEGTLLKLGNQLHVIVQLVDVATDAPLLTRTFTGQVETIRHVRAAIAWTAAGEIAAALEQPFDSLLRARAS